MLHVVACVASAVGTMQRVFPRRVLSGIQPTGIPHIGNYLGALMNWGGLQPTSQDDKTQVLYMVVDLHAITVPYEPAMMSSNIRDMAASAIACGVDPTRSKLFLQSQVKEHAELGWLLGCVTPMGWLRRMTQFKEKASKADKAFLGLFSYPVLMAADILVYQATTVPVGDDQSQHLELARDIAASFNSRFQQPVFPVPEGIFPTGRETRVMSLRNPSSKMSKSDKSDASRINMTDSADVISKKIRKAKSDAEIGIRYDPEARPELANLLSIYSAVTDESVDQICARLQNASMKLFKEELAEAVISHVTPIGCEIDRLRNDEMYLNAVLEDGRDAASELAATTMREVKAAMGLPPSA